MLGRKDFTKEEVKHATETVNGKFQHSTPWLVLGAAAPAKKAGGALDELEGVLFNNMVLVLDRFFVHRLRSVTGKDGNPLNEVELLADSIMNNGSVLRNTSNVIKYAPDKSVLKLKVGDPIRLTAAKFEELASAFFDDLKRKYVRST